MFEKVEFSELSDNYPLKTGPETVDFTRFFKGYRRNEVSPTKGIDTVSFNCSFHCLPRRNEVSPTKGIDTSMGLASISSDAVEMK